jgi:RNA-directed DNA polymerase
VGRVSLCSFDARVARTEGHVGHHRGERTGGRGVLDWDAIDWRTVEDNVRRLRQRIFKASQAGDLNKVRNLRKLMLSSFANTLVSVRRVTQRNAGGATAGVDGQVALTSPAWAELATWVQSTSRPWQARRCV